MINYTKELVSALNKVLPTYYEMQLGSKTKVPCISYMELNNYSSTPGETIGYSRITYQVKVWGHEIAVINDYAIQIDAILRPLGFTRVSSGELYDPNSTMIQKILTFEAHAIEEY